MAGKPSPPDTMPASASGVSTSASVRRRLACTASCVARASVPWSGPRTDGYWLAPAAMGSSESLLGDDASLPCHGHLPIWRSCKKSMIMLVFFCSSVAMSGHLFSVSGACEMHCMGKRERVVESIKRHTIYQVSKPQIASYCLFSILYFCLQAGLLYLAL